MRFISAPINHMQKRWHRTQCDKQTVKDVSAFSVNSYSNFIVRRVIKNLSTKKKKCVWVSECYLLRVTCDAYAHNTNRLPNLKCGKLFCHNRNRGEKEIRMNARRSILSDDVDSDTYSPVDCYQFVFFCALCQFTYAIRVPTFHVAATSLTFLR